MARFTTVVESLRESVIDCGNSSLCSHHIDLWIAHRVSGFVAMPGIRSDIGVH